MPGAAADGDVDGISRRPLVAIAPLAYRRHRRLAATGHYDDVVATTADTLARLGHDAAADRWGPGVVARFGMALARRQQLVAARTELTRALTALPGSLAASDLGAGDAAELQLVEVLLALGAFAEARTRAVALAGADRHSSTRAAACRALAALHLTGGDPAGAHHWLDEAAARAALVGGGDLGLALVHADRCAVVAATGQVTEAVTMTFEAVNRLVAADPRSGPGAGIGGAQVVATASVVGLACAHSGDVLSARHLLSIAHQRSTLADRPVTAAVTATTAAAVARLDGDPAGASALAGHAAAVLAHHGAEPARAVAVREMAMADATVGRHASAVAQATHALSMFETLEMPRESATTAALVASLRSPASEPGAGFAGRAGAGAQESPDET